MKRILADDLVLLDERVAIIKKQLQLLGEEFRIAVSQSSETWHDNAPFDEAVEKQAILNQELMRLNALRIESLKYEPKRSNKVQIGSKVVLRGKRTLRILVCGDWSPRKEVDSYRVVSYTSQIGLALIGASVGSTVQLPVGEAIVESVTI